MISIELFSAQTIWHVLVVVVAPTTNYDVWFG